MNMTYSEMKEEIYALVFADENDRVRYENILISGLNYAVRELMRDVCPDIRSVDVVVAEPENLIGEKIRKSVYVLSGKNKMSFQVKNCGSVAFRYSGEGTLKINCGGKVTEYILPRMENFTEYTLSFASEEELVAEFSSQNGMLLKDLGLYEAATDSGPWEKYVMFDLEKLTDGHFAGLYERCPVKSIDEDEIYDGYYFEQPCRIYFDKGKTGSFRVCYYYCPRPFSRNTPGGEVARISYEGAKLACLYAAWRILKDDNERLAAMYYNEYIDARENLRMRNMQNGDFTVDVWIEGGNL